MTFTAGKGTNKRDKYKKKTQVFLFISEGKYIRRQSKARINDHNAKYVYLACSFSRFVAEEDKVNTNVVRQEKCLVFYYDCT